MEKIIQKLTEGLFFQSIFSFMGNMVVNVIKKIDGILGTCSRFLFLGGKPIQNNKIIFMTYDNQFICNPKYIAEEFNRRKLPYELVWIIGENEKDVYKYPPYLKLVRRNSFESFLELTTAKIWVDNSLNCIWRSIPKKRGQIYFETWHGSLGLKKAGAKDVKDKYWVRHAKKMKKYTDYCISNSTFEDMVYRETHWPQTPILRLGHARNDILLAEADYQNKIKEKIYKKYSIDNSVKTVIYAPTFRDDGNFNCYNIDFDMLIRSLETRFGGKWKVFLRFHFHNRTAGSKILGNEDIINVTRHDDMQELLVASDAGISDYSSWVCDFVLTKRPIFLYTVDIEKYNKDRGLYYPLETTPFPIAKNNDELRENILSFNEEDYIKKADDFIKDKGCMDDGHASERIVDKIQELLQVTEENRS